MRQLQSLQDSPIDINHLSTIFVLDRDHNGRVKLPVCVCGWVSMCVCSHTHTHIYDHTGCVTRLSYTCMFMYTTQN